MAYMDFKVNLEIKKTKERKWERREIGKTLPHGDREGKQWGLKTNVLPLVSLPAQQVVMVKMMRLMMTFTMLFPSKNSTFHQGPLKCPVSHTHLWQRCLKHTSSGVRVAHHSLLSFVYIYDWQMLIRYLNSYYLFWHSLSLVLPPVLN